MDKDKITIYLLNNLALIIGEDDGKNIKNAAEIKVLPQLMNNGILIPQHPTIINLFSSTAVDKNFGINIDKRTLDIIDYGKPHQIVIDGYCKFLKGEQPKKSKIFVPKTMLN